MAWGSKEERETEGGKEKKGSEPGGPKCCSAVEVLVGSRRRGGWGQRNSSKVKKEAGSTRAGVHE